MDKITACLVALAIICTTGISCLCLWKLTGANPAAKEVANLAITAMFSAISGGGVGYALGKESKPK